MRWPCPPVGDMPGSDRDTMATAYIAVRYAECHTRPMQVHPAGCGCDEALCEYARIRESFEIKVLWKLPQSHVEAATDDKAWCDAVKQSSANITRRHLYPVPPCPVCIADPWVVLATVSLPAQPGEAGSNVPQQLALSYRDRRVLLATQRLQTAMLCLP